MTAKIFTPPLYGLVLAGGRSRRMGRDKAALAYHDGVPHARRTADLLAAVCERVFVSCRADQVESKNDSALASLPASVGRIPDTFAVGGPLNGILSALTAHPAAAFLVVACDLPFLSAEALAVLVAGRDASKPVTAFENPARENFLEPLCAIYEPSYVGQAHVAMAQGLTCPTRISAVLDVKRLLLRGPEEAIFLDNANRPEDYVKAHAIFGRGTSGRITVEYFAIFRALAKTTAEEWTLDQSSLPVIYETLRARHGFPLGRESVHVAINDAYASWDAVLAPGDRLAFIPPVSGG